MSKKRDGRMNQGRHDGIVGDRQGKGRVKSTARKQRRKEERLARLADLSTQTTGRYVHRQSAQG